MIDYFVLVPSNRLLLPAFKSITLHDNSQPRQIIKVMKQVILSISMLKFCFTMLLGQSNPVVVDSFYFYGPSIEGAVFKSNDGGRGVVTPTITHCSNKKRYKENLLILQFRQGFDATSYINNLNRQAFPVFTLRHIKSLSNRQNIHLYQPRLSENKQVILDYFLEQPNVISAAWNAPVQFRDSIPNDELYPTQWDLERIGAPKVWEVTTGGTSFHGHEIVVAVLDKGFDLAHPDLASNYWINEAEIPNDGLDNDGNGYVDDVRGWNFRQNSPLF